MTRATGACGFLPDRGFPRTNVPYITWEAGEGFGSEGTLGSFTRSFVPTTLHLV